MDIRKQFSRRSFLTGTTVAFAGSVVLAACSSAPPAVPTVSAPAAAPAAPAAAPAAPTAAPTSTPAPQAQSAPQSSGPAKIVVWKFGGATAELDYFPKMNDVFVKKTNIQLEYSNNEWSVKREKMLAAYQAKRLPDVLLPDGQSIPDLASLGAILPLDEMDKKLTESWKPNFIPEIWATTMYKGKWYALPPYVDSGTFLTVNKKMLADAGVTKVPDTWVELRDAAKKLTTATLPGITISVSADTNDANTFEGIAYANGGRWLDDANKKVTIADPGFIDALQLYVDLVKDKVVPQGPTETNFAQSGTMYFQEKVAMWVSLSYPGAFQQGMKVRDDFPVGYNLFPRQAKPSGSAPPASMIMTPTAAFMITSLSQNRDAALKYIDFWAQPDTEKGWDGSAVLGRVPALKANWETDTFKKLYPDWQKLYKDGKMFAGAVSMPAFPGLSEAEKALSTAMQEAVLGKSTPKEALTAAAKRAQAIVDEFNF